jgi:antitoxin ParD1/3/4
MNVSLTAELERYVTRKVASGMYQTASEVVRESLRLLREHDKLQALRQDIAVGIAQADAGRTAPLKAMETLARLRRERKPRAPKKK